MRERDLVAASTILDEQGRAHLMFFRSVDPQKLQIRLRTEVDTVAVTTETDPELRVQGVERAVLSAMPVADQQRKYPLPSLWRSRGQVCRTEQPTFASGTFFEEAIEAAIETDVAPPRLYFDLDDFVLVNASEAPIGFARDLDLTIFHHDMSIRAARTPQVYFSDTAGGINHFTGSRAYYTKAEGAAKTTRVVRRGTKFYDLKRERTHRGRLIGVRAAVAGDHPHERIFLKQEPGTGPNLSNCDMHYFEDVASDPAVPARSISVLLVFFSVRIRWLVKDPNGTELQKLQAALGRAAERWSGASLAEVLAGAALKTPDVRLRTDDGLHDLKFAFHFPAFDDREGHAAMWLRNEPRAFSLSTFGIIVVAKKDSIAGGTEAGIEYAHLFPSETIAHELGHSMGLGDEYFERFGGRGMIPGVKQYPWDFLHFSFDDHSLMHGEFAPRLRHYWVFSRWLEHSEKVARVKEGGYSIACDTTTLSSSTGGRAHEFRLPGAHPWPYDATREDMQFRPGHGGRGRLGLYLLGDDFDVHNFASPGPLSGVDAVLYWDLAVYFRRRRNAEGKKLPRKSPPGGGRTMLGHLEALFKEMALSIGAMRVSTAANVPRCLVLELDGSAPAEPLAQKHVRKVLLYILPRFTPSNPAAADFRVHIRPHSNKPGADVTDLHDPAFRRRKIAVHEGVPGPALLRYMMGLGPSAARPGTRIEISTTPLPVGGSFSIGSSTLAAKSLHVVHRPRTPGADDYDGSGTPEQVATDLAEAINDSENYYASHIRAAATGTDVSLESVPPGADVQVNSPPPGTSARGEWSGEFEPSELGFLSDWLGEQLGATYRIKLYV